MRLDTRPFLLRTPTSQQARNTGVTAIDTFYRIARRLKNCDKCDSANERGAK